MSDDQAQAGEKELMSVVGEARARLQRIAGREMLRNKAWWVLGAGAAVAASRPWTWRLAAEAPLWTGIGRALVLFAVGSTAAAIALSLFGRRRGPTEIGAARAVDEAMGTPEVITSGFAFAKGGREEPVVMIARKRAAEKAASVRARDLPAALAAADLPRGGGVRVGNAQGVGRCHPPQRDARPASARPTAPPAALARLWFGLRRRTPASARRAMRALARGTTAT